MTNEISWEALEFPHKERGVSWYTKVILVGLVVIVLSIIFDNVLFAIFTLLVTVSFIILGNREPETIRFLVNDRGIIIDNTLYTYEDLESFWLRPEENMLVVKSDKPLAPYHLMPLGEVTGDEVESILKKHLPEAPHERDFVEKVSEFIQF